MGTMKFLHLIDLIKNWRFTYESLPRDKTCDLRDCYLEKTQVCLRRGGGKWGCKAAFENGERLSAPQLREGRCKWGEVAVKSRGQKQGQGHPQGQIQRGRGQAQVEGKERK